MDRRSFLKGAAALFAAPAIVKAESIMPIWVPPEPKIFTHPITLDFPNKLIHVNSDCTLQWIYSYLKVHWREDDLAMKYPFPMQAVSKDFIHTEHGWSIDESSISNLKPRSEEVILSDASQGHSEALDLIRRGGWFSDT